MHRSSKLSICFRISNQNTLHFSYPPYTYITRSTQLIFLVYTVCCAAYMACRETHKLLTQFWQIIYYSVSQTFVRKTILGSKNKQESSHPCSNKYGVWMIKGKGRPQQAEVAQGVPGRLRPRIFLTFSITRVVGRQPYALATITPRRNPRYSILEAESTPGHMVPLVATEKIPSDTTGNRSWDRPTSSAVP